MKNLLLIGASNYLAQELIKTLPMSTHIVGICKEEDTERHTDFLTLKQNNLHKEIFDIAEKPLTWVDSFSNTHGSFDSMVYFPCYSSLKPFLDISADEFQKSVEMNGKLPFLIAQKLIPGMKKIGHGRFVFISTIWSIKGDPKKGNDYAITKSMLNQLSKQITASFMQDNITSASLMFGSVNMHIRSKTEPVKYTEENRVIEYKEIAEFIVTLLDEQKRSFAGATTLLDNGTLRIQGVY